MNTTVVLQGYLDIVSGNNTARKWVKEHFNGDLSLAMRWIERMTMLGVKLPPLKS